MSKSLVNLEFQLNKSGGADGKAEGKAEGKADDVPNNPNIINIMDILYGLQAAVGNAKHAAADAQNEIDELNAADAQGAKAKGKIINLIDILAEIQEAVLDAQVVAKNGCAIQD